MINLKIPNYRINEIKNLYKLFCCELDKSKIKKKYDIEYRKKEFYKILKSKYNWINNE